MITVVLWKWGRKYTRRHIEVMQSMLARHLSLPHRIVCITDRPDDLPSGVDSFDIRYTIPRADFKCIRRMWLYAGESKPGKKWPGDLGERLFQVDIDVVITGSLDAIVGRPEPFVIWKSDSNYGEKWAYNATVMLLTPGARADVWTRYREDPKRRFAEAEAAGYGAKVNSDQAMATYLMKDSPPAVWTTEDGIYAYRVLAGKNANRDEGLPANARLVSFHGSSKEGPTRDPSNAQLYHGSPWIAQHWR